MKKTIIMAAMLMALVLSSAAYAAAPLETVKGNVNRVLDILRDPALQGKALLEKKKEKLRAVYYDMFDERELSRRCLSRNWAKLTADQQKEFIHLFRQILENTYSDRILAYKNERIVFDKESALSSTQAEVYTRIITASSEVPIFYRLILSDGSWKVYDVVIENISLVQNYRSQFDEILAKNPPEKMLEILRNKLK
ncbi:MAG: ABC transporter substrate-binding protein [Syntrophobacterales bacterium]|nr:ABC transporter substrate-binding protein [Syntrophobacterales bacterium]